MLELCRDLCRVLCKTMLELYRNLCTISVLTMLELCHDARENVCRDEHKTLCPDAKHILWSLLNLSDTGWSCEGRSVVNGLSDDTTFLWGRLANKQNNTVKSMPRFLVNAHLQCSASIRAKVTDKPLYESLSKALNDGHGWLKCKLSRENST